MTVESCPTTGFHETRPWVYETEHGMYVKHADYASLQAENERLDKSNTSLLGTIDIIDDKYGELQAEVERLRKAGDAMDAYLKRLDGTTNGMLDCRRAWQAAKGVQP